VPSWGQHTQSVAETAAAATAAARSSKHAAESGERSSDRCWNRRWARPTESVRQGDDMFREVQERQPGLRSRRCTPQYCSAVKYVCPRVLQALLPWCLASAVAPYLEHVLLYDSVDHVCRNLPQHSDHGNVGLACTRGGTHQDVLIAAQSSRAGHSPGTEEHSTGTLVAQVVWGEFKGVASTGAP
jgi:hypothetical protein